MRKPFRREREAVTTAAAEVSATATRTASAVNVIMVTGIIAVTVFFFYCLYKLGSM